MNARTTITRPKPKRAGAPGRSNGGSLPAPDVTPIPNHPLAQLFGSFDDEPLWEDWMKAIGEYREEVNALDREAA